MATLKTFNLSTIQPNPLNPRTISEKQFSELVASILHDPDFLRRRRIIYADGIILGGNQRYRAVLAATEDAGFRERIGTTKAGIVLADWVEDASDWDEEQRRRFVIVDNAPRGMSGDWDYDMLANMPEWNELPLGDWGLSPETDAHQEEPLLREKIDQSPPTMTWVLIGIPTIQYDKIAQNINDIMCVNDVFCEVSVNDKNR